MHFSPCLLSAWAWTLTDTYLSFMVVVWRECGSKRHTWHLSRAQYCCESLLQLQLIGSSSSHVPAIRPHLS